MTEDQQLVFVEERIWEYLGKSVHYFSLCRFVVQTSTSSFPFYYSLWLHGCPARGTSHHRFSLYSVQPNWCSYVGTWYAPTTFSFGILNASWHLDLEKRQHFIAAQRLTRIKTESWACMKWPNISGIARNYHTSSSSRLWYVFAANIRGMHSIPRLVSPINRKTVGQKVS
jgi:hypothetical protein